MSVKFINIRLTDSIPFDIFNNNNNKSPKRPLWMDLIIQIALSLDFDRHRTHIFTYNEQTTHYTYDAFTVHTPAKYQKYKQYQNIST